MGLKLNTYAGFAMVFLLAGCASNPPQQEEEDFATRLMAEKAAIAAAAQRDYAALLAEDYATLQKRWTAFDADTIDVDFIGNPKELVETIASRYGMSFGETGQKLDLKTINIRVKGVKPDAVLRNIGNQIHAGADLIFDRSTKSLTIEYKNRNKSNQNERKGG